MTLTKQENEMLELLKEAQVKVFMYEGYSHLYVQIGQMITRHTQKKEY